MYVYKQEALLATWAPYAGIVYLLTIIIYSLNVMLTAYCEKESEREREEVWSALSVDMLSCESLRTSVECMQFDVDNTDE